MRKASGTRAPARHTLSYQLQEIIDSRGLSSYAAAELAGVDPGVVSRWMNGVRGITLDTADRLAEALGVRLVETAAGRSRPRSPKPGRPLKAARAVPAPPEVFGEPKTGPESNPDPS